MTMIDINNDKLLKNMWEHKKKGKKKKKKKDFHWLLVVHRSPTFLKKHFNMQSILKFN
jgi:hypothetical protein